VRTGLPAVASKSLLLGIIEGPPPVPNENLNIPDALDPLTINHQPGAASTSYGTNATKTDQTEYQIGLAVVLGMEAKSNIGVDIAVFTAKAYAKAKWSLRAGLRTVFTDVEQVVTTSANTCKMELEQSPTAVYSVQLGGQVILADLEWTGYPSRSGSC